MKTRKKSARAKAGKNREVLAEARRRIQVRAVPLVLGGMLVARLAPLFRDEPWILVACMAYVMLLGGLSIRWIVGYRRLKAELGLAGEYDELDENAGWGAKTFLILFGGFAAFFVLLFWFISVAGRH